MWEIYKEFRFEAAHRLPHHDGKCSRLHGHSWVCRIYVRGEDLFSSGSKQGMVMDFDEVKHYTNPLLEDFLDHHYLNETLSIENPTSELVAQWIYHKLKEANFPGLFAVEIKETCTSGCIYLKHDLSHR